MAKKLFVGNLSFEITSEDLQATFAQLGTVTLAKVVSDRHTGRSKGYGFVEMENDESAIKAIQVFHGREWNSRQIIVSEAKDQTLASQERRAARMFR